MTYDTRGHPLAEPPPSDTDQREQEQQESEEELVASFPVSKLSTLNGKISSPRWVVPVMPEQELECLLNYSIKLSQLGADGNCEPCQKFYRDELTTSFLKILTDEAVNSWKYNIHHCILMSCGKLMHLCALNIKTDNAHLLDLLAVVLDPENKFHTHNSSRQPELYTLQPPTSSPLAINSMPNGGVLGILTENQVFAKQPPEPRSPKGWLVDLINHFGQKRGFDSLLERFNAGMASVQKLNEIDNLSNTTSLLSVTDTSAQKSTNSSSTISNKSDDKQFPLSLIFALVRPFGQCADFLTVPTIEKYFMPVWEYILNLLENLSDIELKREAKLEGKNDTISGIVKAARCLIERVPNQEAFHKAFEMCRLKIILRVLQISSFNGKMNALNEINKMLGMVSYYPHRPQTPDDDMEFLTADRMAKWIKDEDVLGIVLKDSLHQPQYVEKLEKILRFLIKEKALTLDDLDAVWRAQAGKHEAIVKNVHDLLAKLAWDFNAQQLDHLFECFQASMKTANKKQRERLLELNRRLAEDDKNGVMAHKVLQLFWTLAHSTDISPEVLDQALTSHVKILDYSCSQERDAQKTVWLDRCVEELRFNDTWALPALKLVKEICCLYEATNHAPRVHPTMNRQQVIDRLQSEHSLVILVTKSLTNYMDRVRTLLKEQSNLKPSELMLDNRYPHSQQIQERLEFLKFLLKDGQLWLCADQAKQIWNCLAVNAAFPSDREECFRWFGKLMGDEPDLDPGINKDFFENNLLQLDPVLLTESGIRCFERFFKAVNSKEEKLKAKNRGYVLDDEDLIGKDYLWRVITTGGEEIAHKAIELLKEVSTALGSRLQAKVEQFHENFIDECCDRLKALMDNIMVLTNTSNQETIKELTQEASDTHMRMIEAEKMCRVVKVLQEYIKECDRTFTGDRYFLPLGRASRGKHIVLYIRFQTPGKALDDIEVTTHSNETIISFKRNLLKRIKATPFNNIKVDLFNSNGELIEIIDDRHPLSQYNIRDKAMINAKLTPLGTGMASSPDSSSDSSTGSPPRPCPDMQRTESEATLPGVIISHKSSYTGLFIKIYQLGSELEHCALRDGSRTLLHLLPLDHLTVLSIQEMCNHFGESNGKLEEMLLSANPAQVLYNLEVMHVMLVPALDPIGEAALNLQSSWLHSGVAHFVLDLLTKNNFMSNADAYTRRAAFQCTLRLVKLFLYIVGCVLSRVGDEPSTTSAVVADGVRLQVDILKHALGTMPGSSEYTIRTVASKMAATLAEEMLSACDEGDRCRQLFDSALKWMLPDISTIKAIVQLTWAAANGNTIMTNGDQTTEVIHTPIQQDVQVCREALEVLSISLVLNPSANEALIKDHVWSTFIRSLLIMNPSRHIRQAVAEQLLVSCTYCASDRRPYVFLIKLLISSLHDLVPQYAISCAEFFQLLCRIINYGYHYNWSLSVNETLLKQEITWLQTVQENVKKTGESQVHEDLLGGHLCLAKELLVFINPETKASLNSLISEFIDDFLFPASRQYLALRRTSQLTDCKGPPPVCRTSHTIAAASELLVALCQNSVPNMKLLVDTLTDMFSSDTEPLKEWEYLPPVGPRPSKGFVGLKNAGATCYMNSVLQQLFMVPLIRVGILRATGACTDPNEDFSGELEVKNEYDRYYQNREETTGRRNYHVGILKYVQAIFAHLGHSSLQYYVPRGLWTHFKLQGEPVNLREQQDAVEFFMSLFESLDEGLKALGHPLLMGATLGGCFSDQKICQGCPHRYSKDEPFSVFSVDIRNHSSLTDSLEQYVKGELLEGADAYHCDKCDKKVVTIKRLCVRKLPPVLAFQLKRFEYDYERVCAIKFNDYFEFPRWLDMEPYTVSGLAKIEGEVIDLEDNMYEKPVTTKYQLTGIVVHSGQASGGHYFSFVLHKNPNGTEQWYKFDDGEVTECKMHEDEEMKAQCFGGDYLGEVYDNNLKRMQYRRQKRWWNAYMLFYTRCDQQPIEYKQSIEQLSLAESKNCVLPMPEPIEKSVRSQNIRFLHARSFFSVEFFTFIRKLVNSTVPSPRSDKLTQSMEELSLLGIQLAAQFLFHSGLRTKKTLRGAAIDWYDVLCQHIRYSAAVRRWFASNVLLSPPSRLAEYILVAPSPEVRTVFVKLVVFFCHFAINDDPLPDTEGTNLCEQILIAVLNLLKSEVVEHGKHLPHYFSLFSMYAGLGVQEKRQLLKLNVPGIFMQVASEEGPSIKYQTPDMSKLHQVVASLVRSSDISSRCQGSSQQMPVRPNIYAQPTVPLDSLGILTAEAQELLFSRTSYIKKLIEDTNVGEDGIKLLQYCSWENPHFSRNLLIELLLHCGFAYVHDMRHFTELLLSILLIEDSWQHHRIHNAIMGISDGREGLLDTIHMSKNNYQKRAYQCIKCLVQLFNRSQVALAMLNNNQELARQWVVAVEWLQDELERQRTIGGQYNYSSWSPPAQSNESTNSFILERSLSAKNVLRRAVELCPEEEPEESNELEADTDDTPQEGNNPDSDQQVPIATISHLLEKSAINPASSPMHQANPGSLTTDMETGEKVSANSSRSVENSTKSSSNQLSSSSAPNVSPDNTSSETTTATTQIHNTSTETNSDDLSTKDHSIIQGSRKKKAEESD